MADFKIILSSQFFAKNRRPDFEPQPFGWESLSRKHKIETVYSWVVHVKIKSSCVDEVIEMLFLFSTYIFTHPMQRCRTGNHIFSVPHLFAAIISDTCLRYYRGKPAKRIHWYVRDTYTSLLSRTTYRFPSRFIAVYLSRGQRFQIKTVFIEIGRG